MADGGEETRNTFPRLLDAAAVGRALGREKRVVLLWAKQGTKDHPSPCPHSLVRSRGQMSPRFNLDEVKAWLDAAGVELERGEAAGGVEPTTEPESLYAYIAKAMTNPTDFEAMLVRARVAVHDVLAHRPAAGVGGVNAQHKWAAAFAAASGELRQLEVASDLAKKRRGELVDRQRVARVMGELGALFKSSLVSLAGDAARAGVQALEEAGVLRSDDAERARRLLILRTETAVHAVLATLAGEIDRQLGGAKAA